MKSKLVILLFLGLLAHVSAAYKDCAHHIDQPASCFVAGARTIFTESLIEEVSANDTAFPFIKKTGLFQFPAQNDSNLYLIDFIQVANKMQEGQEGLVTLVAGGVGYDHAVFNMESKTGLGYNFLFTIAGILL